MDANVKFRRFEQPILSNGKCLQPQNGNNNGSPVVLADCTGSADQKWTFANGAVTIYNGAMCLVGTLALPSSRSPCVPVENRGLTLFWHV
jgi:hypothetical protein